MWPRMHFLDLQGLYVLDRWPNDWIIFKARWAHIQGKDLYQDGWMRLEYDFMLLPLLQWWVIPELERCRGWCGIPAGAAAVDSGGIPQFLSKSQCYWSTAPKYGHMTTYQSKDLIGRVTWQHLLKIKQIRGATHSTLHRARDNTGNTIATLWSNTDSTVLCYRATQTTPYFSMEQRGQHHTSLWSNTDNTVLLYGFTEATRTPPYISMAMRVLHHHSLRLRHGAKTLYHYNLNTTPTILGLYNQTIILEIMLYLWVLSQNVDAMTLEWISSYTVTVASLYQSWSCAFCSWCRTTVQNVHLQTIELC